MWRDARDGAGAGAAAAPRAASPGLLRRRYSVPETIMRKYRLAQQKSDSEVEPSGGSPASTAARGACPCCTRGARRDRDPMRKSALLRFWGRAGASPLRSCGCQPGTRSLDGSHSELRTPRCLTPKRFRLDSFRERDTVKPTINQQTNIIIKQKTESPTFSEKTALLTDVVSDCLTSLKPEHSTYAISDDCSFTDSSDSFTKSLPTTKETKFDQQKYCSLLSTSCHIDGHVEESSFSADNDGSNIVPFDQPLSVDTQKYDVLEIVVSETLNLQSTPAIRVAPSQKVASPIKSTVLTKRTQNIDIDEFVSNILVESLNSLTDQLETMNASMGYDKKLNIVEKEIKVKLQNTGVNTIVHLSPTSNNQIIFGNEELFNNDDRKDNENDSRKLNSFNIRESALSLETNNNLTSAESLRDNNSNNGQQPPKDSFQNATNNDNINKSILHQIQKLFQDEFKKSSQGEKPSLSSLPNISHIEISNVDVFLNDNAGTFAEADTIEIQTQPNRDNTEVLGGVGTRNYYDEVEDNSIVPRLSAMPHSDSMEVNTSSSDDTDIIGSECTSLVDSLDDPNSPRSILLRRAYTNSKRSELVRSSIDVLDLLPENASQSPMHSPKEKGEAFFIRIKDDNCDCDKENVVVADHMPETIKQRLYRRHRKREQRMESVRKSKVKQLRKDIVKQRNNENYKTRKEIEKECMAIINTLIDDVIAKIAQDEYKYMRIKERSNKIAAAKSEDNLNRRLWKKVNDKKSQLSKSKIVHSNSCQDYSSVELNNRSKQCPQMQTPSTPEGQRPKRIYQKSEIHDGNNCIEILEILEYVNNSHSSTETTATNSDENHNNFLSKNKKSRIPIPTYKRIIKKDTKNDPPKGYTSNCARTPPIVSRNRNERTKHLLASMLLDAFDEGESFPDTPVRRTGPFETRIRSNSLRFQNSFDIIPEEKSSLSMDSTSEGINGRRASAPSLGDSLSSDQQQQPDKNQSQKTPTRRKILKNASTSPMPDIYKAQSNVAATTSPFQKCASTSPIRLGVSEQRGQIGGQRRGQIGAHSSGRERQRTMRRGDEGSQRRKSVTTQYEEQIRTIQSEPEIKRERKIKSHNCLARDIDINEIIKEKRKKPERIQNRISRKKYDERDRIRDSNGKREKSQREEDGSVDSCTEASSSSGESGSSLLCSLAPAWLGARRRRRAPRAARAAPSGDWAVTVAGSCAAALPNDVEMRLRFPDARAPRALRAPLALRATGPAPAPSACASAVTAGCGGECGECGRVRRRGSGASGRLTLTLKKEASDSAVLATKSVKKSTDLLPDLETFRASRSKTKSSVKTRRGYSLHCWLPEEDPTQMRPRNGLSVLGSAIVPEHKPRAPSMSERDLTRLYTPRRRQGRARS